MNRAAATAAVRLLVLAGALALPGSAAWAQAAPDPPARTLPAGRVSGAPPTLDGRMDEPVWRQARLTGGFVQHEPNAGGRASERTDVRVLYDHQAIYVGVRLHDSRADSIAAQLGGHDEEIYSDWISVQIDSDHDRRTAYEFSANPVGSKADALLFDDTELDPKWDAVWEVAARRDTAGWTAEFRIPFSQMRFDLPADSSVETRWGINFRRHIARREETSDWAPIPRNSSRMVSLFGTLSGVRGVAPPKRVEVRPYLATRLTRSPPEEGNPFWRRNDVLRSAGADVKVGLGSGLTLSATFNPDFAEVEADRSYVRLGGDYEPFFPEKRPFFLEGAEIFRFSTGGVQLFHPRSIGPAPREPQGPRGLFVDLPTTTPILGAAKLSGKTRDGWSVGLLGALTGSVSAEIMEPGGERLQRPVEPLTGFAVARVSRDLRDGNSTVGGILTATRRSLDDPALDLLRSAAYVAGLDARHRFGGHYQLSGALAASRVEGSRAAIQRLQRMQGHAFLRPDAPHLEYDSTLTELGGLATSLSLSRFGGGRWGWEAGVHTRSPGFEVNDAGYQNQADLATQFVYVRYDRPQAGKRIRRWYVDFNQSSSWTFGAERLDASLGLDGSFQLQSFWGGSWSAYRDLAGLNVRMLGGSGPALVTPGRSRGSLSLYSDRRRPLSASVSASGSVDDEGGGHTVRLGAAATLRASDRLEVSLEPALSRYVNPAQHVASLRLGSDTLFVVGRIQQTTVSLTPRVRYSFNPRLALQLYAMPFLSAAEHAGYREVVDPHAPGFAERFHAYSPRQLSFDSVAGRYQVDRDGDGVRDLTFASPGYSFQEMRAQAVLTWEYLPGSTLHLVWRQDRTGSTRGGSSLDLDRDLGRLLGLPGGDPIPPTNVLILKLSYWLGM